ncbi:MAG: carbohydate-binding domain-containing protein [Bacteroidales bacterium]|nr:carbohydate-binding domain-containing protein [Bacteroidales bacterium]
MKKTIFLLTVSLLLCSCNNMTDQKYPTGTGITLEWEFTGNNISPRSHSSVFTLENLSDYSFGDRGWALFFNQQGRDFIPESATGNVKIVHVNGDLARITPTAGFHLEPGQSIRIDYDKRDWLIKENESPMGPYFVFSDSMGNELAVVPVQHYSIKPFPPLDKIFPPESSIPLPSAEWVYDQNLHQSLLESGISGSIIPTPVSTESHGDKVAIGDGLMIHYQDGLDREAQYLAGMLESVMGKDPAVMESTTGGPNIIHLRVLNEDRKLGYEAYQLTAHPENGVIITGGDPAGVFYGIQSLLAMVPLKAWSKPEANIEIDAVTISDAPAFGYRGMHLDIARNFNEPAAIKKLIRAMAFYKMNKLHLHLTEDEGWRLEIPSLPELTDVGAFRGHTTDNKDYLIPAYGSGPVPDTATGMGSGYLSRDEFIEILQFADAHHIEVIPEINFPGHARAAIYAMEARYDRLVEEGKPEEAEKYRLIDPNDASRYNSAQNFNDNVVCVCKEAPYLLFETVVDDVIEMYREAGLTLEILHAGGDEVPHGSWEGSPVCTDFLRSHPEIGSASNLQTYFEGRLFEILKKKNLIMAGWEEIAMKKDDNGRWIPNPEFTDQGMLPYVWNSLDANLDLGYRLANEGYPVILCNVNNFYFDFAYSHHPAEPGLYWGGFVNTRRAFEFVPYDVYKCTLTDAYGNPYNPEVDFFGMERLKPEAHKNIIGLQGELWSETIKGGEMLEYYYLPKMIGLAERAWSGQARWGSIKDIEVRIDAMNRAWNVFSNVVGQREMPRLDYLFGGFNYRLPPPGALIMNGQLYANIDFPGLTIRYTTDESEPNVDSPVYRGPVQVSGKVSLRSFDTRGRGSRISVVE